MTRWYRPLASTMIIVALWVSVWGVQRQYDQVRLQHIRTIQISVNEFIEPSLPSPIVLEKAAFGFRTVIADLLWLTTIQYYGGGDPYGKYRQLPKLVESITRLDPRFTYPYSFAGLVLPNEGFPDEALSILRTGEKSLPDSWELPYNEATIYYIDKKDSAAAAREYERASKLPGAPPIAQFLSAIQYDRDQNVGTARTIFQNLADSSPNQYFKDRALAYIAHYQLLDELHTVIGDFHQHFGRYPTSLDELVQKRIVAEIPPDPLNRHLQYDPNSGIVQTEIKK